MNLTKYLKGCTTMRELEDMPCHYIHTFYKEYIEMVRNDSAKDALASEQLMDEIEDHLT